MGDFGNRRGLASRAKAPVTSKPTEIPESTPKVLTVASVMSGDLPGEKCLQELHCGTQEDHRQGDYNAAPALESRQGKEGEAGIGAVMDQLIVVEKRYHFVQRRTSRCRRRANPEPHRQATWTRRLAIGFGVWSIRSSLDGRTSAMVTSDRVEIQFACGPGVEE